MNVGANNMILKRRQRKVTKHANPEKASRFQIYIHIYYQYTIPLVGIGVAVGRGTRYGS